MPIDKKFERKHTDLLRDIRPAYVRLADWMQQPTHAFAIFLMGVLSLHFFQRTIYYSDIILIVYILYFVWLYTRDRSLPFKMPLGSKYKDQNNMGPGKSGEAEGILYVGNSYDTDEEIWFTNSDARTHILYLGTTGAGKTEGLKSFATNAMAWGSGFVYVDGKADTDLWSSLSSLVRRFGRDDDLLVLNYMTGNSDVKAPSNTMNPFSSGSASYLTNMLVSLMPDAEGDNAMWKERAVSLISSIMPALTWKRDHQDTPMSVSTIREYLTLPKVIKISRDEVLPEDIRAGIMGYLDTLPGYIDAAYDDDGNPKPPGPDVPQVDTTTPSQQHGFLSMQFTRALQSLGDEYGYIFDTQAADVDMVDVVLNRRILITLIPALEKSSDETANLGKIVAATIKGMMGSALGATVEGESSKVIENKPTASSTPFMTVFDEVGYYTAQGMAVMAAQARSLGFCLIFAAQDLPALQKRVKEEARSITANCNLKIFGKLEDPTDTKDFFEKTVGSAMVMESSGYQLAGGTSTGSYFDTQQAGLQVRARASYDELKDLKEGEAVVCFGMRILRAKIFYSNPGHAKAMRVTRFVALPPPDENMLKHSTTITKVRDLLVHKTWTAHKADVAADTPPEIQAIADTYKIAHKAERTGVECGMAAVAGVYALFNEVEPLSPEEAADKAAAKASEKAEAPTAPVAKKPEPIKENEDTAQTTPKVKKAEPKRVPAKGKDKDDSAAGSSSSGGGNPMGMFAKKPAGEESATPTPAPKEEPKAATPPEEKPEASSTDKPETKAEAPDQSGEEEGVKWDQLVEDAEKTDQSTTAAKDTEEEKPKSNPVKLNPDSEGILRDAGKSIRSSLLKGGDDAEAAE